MKIILKQNRYLLFTILTFIGIVLYELNINPAQLFNKLYAVYNNFINPPTNLTLIYKYPSY
jgi:hypothetical protein